MRNWIGDRRWMLGVVVAGAAVIAAACGGGASFDDPRLQEFDNELTTDGQGHLAAGSTFNYPSTPPYGGPHLASLLPCRVYQDEQQAERYVHTMEHGAVILHYQPDVFAGDDVAALRVLGSELLDDGKRVMVLPNRALSSPIVVASWGRLLPLDELEPDTIRAFVDAFENDGPENLPRRSSC